MFDAHFGWEKTYRGGDMVTVPVHNLPAVRATMRFVQDYAPDVFILGGDNINCGPVSRWHNGKPRLIEGLRLKDEMDLIDELVLTPVAKVKDKRFHLGNHEYWIYDYVNANPGLEGLVEPHRYLRLAERGWKVYEFGAVSKLGKLKFAHGDGFLKANSAANAAARLVQAYGCNIRVGHRHTWLVAPKTTPVDQKEVHTGMLVPCLCTRAPEYVKGNPNDFLNGFFWGEVWPDGMFSDYVSIICGGKFSVNGRMYDGNKK